MEGTQNNVLRMTPKQETALQILASDATDCGLAGGSRSGKTFALCYAVASRALRVPGSRHAILRFRFNTVRRAVMQDTWPKMMKAAYPQFYEMGTLNKSDGYWKSHHGSEVWFGGLDDKDRVEKLLGTEYSTVFFNECSEIPWPSVKLAHTRLAERHEGLQLKNYYDFNPPSKRHWTYRYFVEKRSPDNNKPLPRPENISLLYLNPRDNEANLDPAYLERLANMSERERKRFYLGEFSDEDKTALFSEETFDAFRVTDTKDLPTMARVVVAVDPSGCASDDVDTRSDEIGIVVVGLGVDGKGYVLEDVSGHYAPNQWGKLAVETFEKHSADRIVAEGNFGGAMVEHTIAASAEEGQYAPPVKLVRATRGKIVRAEPISTLYEKGRIHHVGHFPEMEEQALGFYPSGYKGSRSPDRMDACIWGLTDLFPEMASHEGEAAWIPNPVVKTPMRAEGYGPKGKPVLTHQHRPGRVFDANSRDLYLPR